MENARPLKRARQHSNALSAGHSPSLLLSRIQLANSGCGCASEAMTFHREEHAVPHSTEIAQNLQDRTEWHSQQQPKRRKQQQPVIDLASQSSVELCSPPSFTAAELGVSQRSLQALDPQQGQHAGADAHGQQAAAAGQKRLWGDMAADDVTLVGSLPPPSMLWGSTRQRARRMRPSGDAAAVSTPILIMDEDSPANLSNDMKQQLRLQGPQGDGRHANRHPIVSLRTNPTRSPPMRPVSITPNPAIASMGAGDAAAGLGHAPPSAAVAARRRAVLRRAAAAPMPAPPAAAADAGQRRNSNSSSSSAEAVDVDADAALARRLAQEEEDRALAHRLMQEEEQAEQARLRANRNELEALQAAVGMQAAAAGAPTARRSENRRAFKAPAMPIMPPGCDPADTVLFQQQVQRRALSGAAAAAAAPVPSPQQQQQHGQMRSYDFGQMMAQMLLSMPMGRAGRATGGQAGSSAARRGLPPSLVHMREAVIGMQRAGLPPHMLFSDRDFTADDYELLCRLDETVENRKGAASTTIEALPTQTVPSGGLAGAAGERLSCAVCLEEFAEGSELRSLPCLHRFHKGCIDTWLRQKASCPVCNRDCT